MGRHRLVARVGPLHAQCAAGIRTGVSTIWRKESGCVPLNWPWAHVRESPDAGPERSATAPAMCLAVDDDHADAAAILCRFLASRCARQRSVAPKYRAVHAYFRWNLTAT